MESWSRDQIGNHAHVIILDREISLLKILLLPHNEIPFVVISRCNHFMLQSFHVVLDEYICEM